MHLFIQIPKYTQINNFSTILLYSFMGEKKKWILKRIAACEIFEIGTYE